MSAKASLNDANALLTLAQQAVALFGYPQAHLTPLAESDNTVFRADEGNAHSFALRLHTSGRQRAAALTSELIWLGHLAERTDLPVPKPVRSKAGTWLVGVPGKSGALHASMLMWIQGEVLDRPLSVPEAGEAGRLLAHLHLEAERFEPPNGFERPAYTLPAFLNCFSELQASLGRDNLSAEDRIVLQAGLAEIMAQLTQWNNLPGGFGLIHGDLHSGNLIRNGKRLSLIDFDRCGWGPYLLDIAGAVLDMEPGERAAFIAGYHRQRPLPEGYTNPVRALMCLSALENLAFLAKRPHEIPYVLKALPTLVSVVCEVSGQPQPSSPSP